MVAVLERPVFKVSRAIEYFTEKELQMQIGYSKSAWPIVLVKELVDNSLDACEAAGIAPQITIALVDDSVSIQDNGKGLPESILNDSLDYMVRASTNTLFVSPSRGQLGNALKALWAAPFVATGSGHIEVETADYAYRVRVSLDGLTQDVKVSLESIQSFVQFGTKITIHWDEIASLLDDKKKLELYGSSLETPDITTLCHHYAALNPHLTIGLTIAGNEMFRQDVEDSQWKKWKPNQPTSPYWYSREAFKSLLGWYCSSEGDTLLRQFIGKFDGLARTQTQKAVMELLNDGYPWVQRLSDLVTDGQISDDTSSRLLIAMCHYTKPAGAARLGCIGRERIWSQMTGDRESFQYKKVEGFTSDGLPFVVEVAFGIDPAADGLTVLYGLNWTSTLNKQPTYKINWLWNSNEVEVTDPIWIVLHIACPKLGFTERGKGAVQIDEKMWSEISQAFNTALKKWKAHKKKLARGQRMTERQLEEARKASNPQKLSIKTAAYRVMEQAYLHASAGGTLPANARQIMYAARPLVLELIGSDREGWKNSSYFTQELLPDFIANNPGLTANWDVVYDARGHIKEPHTGESIDLGTLAVRDYLRGWHTRIGLPSTYVNHGHISTMGPNNRYRYALFIEKEGFDSLFQRVRPECVNDFETLC